MSFKLRVLLTSSLAFSFMFIAPRNALAVIQSLDGLTVQYQTFVDDSNVTITPSGSTHTLGWQGQLPMSRGGTGASSFSAGSILFSNGTSILEDNSNFFWDNINKRLRIGSSSSIGSIFAPNAVTANTSGTTLVMSAGDGNGSGFGGELNLAAGGGGITGNGGQFNIDSGPGGTTSGNGGNISVTAGDALTDGIGGNIDLQAGGGGETSGDGGHITLLPGTAEGSGANGNVMIIDPTNFSIEAIFDTSLLSTSQMFTFPNSTGTFSLLETNQTLTGLNKFEATSNSTIYIGSSTKTSCIALGDSDGSGITYVTVNDGVISATTTKPSFCQ